MRSSKSRPPRRRHGPLVVDERPRHRPGIGISRDVVGRDPQLDLQPRDGRVEAQSGRLVGPGRHAGDDRRTIGQRLRGNAGVGEDLAAESVERPDPDRTGRDAERRDGRIEPLGHLDRRPLVERDGSDRVRRRPGRDQPGRSRDERRGLARAGRGDAQRRAGWGGGCSALVRREAGEPVHDRRVEDRRMRFRCFHAPSLCVRPASSLTSCPQSNDSRSVSWRRLEPLECRFGLANRARASTAADLEECHAPPVPPPPAGRRVGRLVILARGRPDHRRPTRRTGSRPSSRHARPGAGAPVGTEIKPIITVGDTIGCYRFEAIPDGITYLPAARMPRRSS